MRRRDDWITDLLMQERLNRLYYFEKEKIVFTEQHHINRGFCCGSKCRHCPYEPKHEKGTTTLKTNQL